MTFQGLAAGLSFSENYKKIYTFHIRKSIVAVNHFCNFENVLWEGDLVKKKKKLYHMTLLMRWANIEI